MSKVFFDISMSFDGYIAGPNVSKQFPMGEGGMRLHDWLFSKKTDAGKKVLDEMLESAGAVIVGGRTYHLGIDEWGGVSPFTIPAFVLCHKVPEKLIEGFRFVTAGIESALAQAKSAAGNKDVWVMGGADIARQYIQAGLLDEIQIHLIHVLLGDGVRLFDHATDKQVELEQTKLVETPGVTHFTFSIVK